MSRTARRTVTVVLTVLALLALVFAVSQSKPATRIELSASADVSSSVEASATATVCPGFAHYVDETGGWWIYATATTPVIKAHPSGWWVKTAPTSPTYALIMEDNGRYTVRWDAYGNPHTDAIAIGQNPETRCDF
jgi:hypothetical protein